MSSPPVLFAPHDAAPPPPPPSAPIRTPPARRGAGPAARLLALAWTGYAGVLLFFAAQNVGLECQYLLGAAALGALMLLHLLRPSGFLRVLLILLVAFVSVRYFAWRTLYTIPSAGSPGFVPGLLLYLAELQGMSVYMLGVFVNIRPRERAPAPLPDDAAAFPSVDVLVPSYNEDRDLLRVTLTAATQIRYPAAKLRVYLLDDGGTSAKRADPDRRKAAAAWERHETLQHLCAELGVGYLTREHNAHAKAGNINAALPRTTGELILILDADHVPAQDILERTVGHFLNDPDLFLVQTPHFFINPDPIERNLGTFSWMPGENEMFYGVVQKGLDAWNASFFCGSAAVLRRSHLLSVGGIAGTSITEDAETALELHSRGYKSLYVDRPMVAGLSPDTFSAFITQRIRWAQGMAQILLLKNPMFKRGLTLPQRLCYLSSSTFWLFPFARLVFLIAPLFYLFFGLKVFVGTLEEFFAFATFHVVCSLMLSNFLFGRHRLPYVSDLYELLQSVFTIGALLDVIRNPRKPTFKVTPKAETVAQDFVSQLAAPFFAIVAVLVGATAVGVWRWYDTPLERGHLLIVMGWNLVNLALATAAVGVVFERGQTAVRGWIARTKPVNLLTAHGAVRATLTATTTASGTLVVESAGSIGSLETAQAVGIQAHVPGRDGLVALRIAVEERRVERGRVVLDFRYVPQDADDDADLVRLCYGDSETWVQLQRKRQRRRIIPASLARLFLLGLRRTITLVGARMQGRTLGAATPVEPLATDFSGTTR